MSAAKIRLEWFVLAWRSSLKLLEASRIISPAHPQSTVTFAHIEHIGDRLHSVNRTNVSRSHRRGETLNLQLLELMGI